VLVFMTTHTKMQGQVPQGKAVCFI